MPASVLLAQFLLPQAAVSLGRFVTNIDEPHRDFHDPATDTTPYIAEKLQSQYDSTHSSNDQRTFVSELTRFLSSSFSKRAKASIRITSDQVTTYYLNNTGAWFRDAVQSEQTRKWIERTIDEGEEIYVITGYHTLMNALVAERSRGQRDSSGRLVLPVSAALAASGIVAPIGDISDPGMTASSEHAEDEHREFIAEGVQICAVQYRKVRHGWFSSKNVEKMKLARDTRWERYDRPRFLQSDGSDMIEVELEEVATYDAARETCTTEEGEVLVTALGDEFGE